jgi:hypothetical protein
MADETFARKENLPEDISRYTPIGGIRDAFKASGEAIAVKIGTYSASSNNVPRQHRPSAQSIRAPDLTPNPANLNTALGQHVPQSSGAGLAPNPGLNPASLNAPNRHGSIPDPIQMRAENSGDASIGPSIGRRRSVQPSSQQTDPSSSSEADRISQAGNGRANSSTPLGTADPNKPVAPRPPFHPQFAEPKIGGFEMERGNGDNNHRYGAQLNEQTTPNRRSGRPNKSSGKRKSTPDSDEGNNTAPSKRKNLPVSLSENYNIGHANL